MDHYIYELYHTEIDQGNLDFDADPKYRTCLAQIEPFFPNKELPPAWFCLLDRSNFLSFSHGFRLGMQIILWSMGEFRRPGGDPLF